MNENQNQLEKPSEIKTEPSKQHGGTRPGAGRHPKAIRYAQEIAAGEAQIVAAIPRVIEALVKAAEGGDVAASRYLLDRVWGRVATQAAPVAEDISFPLDHQMGAIFARNFGGLRAASQAGEAFAQHPALVVEMREMFEACISPEHHQAWLKKKQQSAASQEEKLKKENEELRGVVRGLVKEINNQQNQTEEDDDEQEEEHYRQAAE